MLRLRDFRACRGGGVVIALASRSYVESTRGLGEREQVSQWAFGSQGFESLPRRHLPV
jgi:hypothetical protein